MGRTRATLSLGLLVAGAACSVEPPTGDFVSASSTQGSGDSSGGATQGESATTGATATATGSGATDEGSTGPSSADASATGTSADASTTAADASASDSSSASASEGTTEPGPSCGDGVVDAPEVCDGVRLGGSACTDLPAPMNGNYGGGALACADDCSAFDESGCTWCGDAVKNGPEICDGNDLGGATCVDAGWLPGGGGAPTCTGACELDGGACTGTMCGGELAAPPDGAGMCAAPWMDTGSACHRDCPQVGMNACQNPIACPADRNCEVVCEFNACAGKTIECAAGHGCDVACSEQSSCTTTTIECPPDGPCTIACAGLNSCSGATVVCPTGNYACEVTCQNQSACPNLDMQCGDGPCSITCDASLNVCGGAELVCGDNACTATCAGNSQAALVCGSSCDCLEC
jgi:hypothetical protein